MFARAVQLMITLAPLAALYPMRGLLRDADSGDVGNIDEWKSRESKKNSSVSESSFLINGYLKFCLRCVECSGAAIVKSMQVSVYITPGIPTYLIYIMKIFLTVLEFVELYFLEGNTII